MGTHNWVIWEELRRGARVSMTKTHRMKPSENQKYENNINSSN